MWPTYLYIGNQSKYPRGKPSECSAHHIAYIPSVSICHSYDILFAYGETSAA